MTREHRIIVLLVVFVSACIAVVLLAGGLVTTWP